MTRPHPARGYLFIAAATFFWGLAAALGRAVFTGKLLAGAQLRPIEPLILAQSRTTISLLLLAPLLLMTRRSALRVRPSHVAQFFVLGIVGLAASNYFYYLAIQRTTVALAIVLQYVAPVWVLLYMLSRRLQRPTLQRISGVGLAVVGCGIAVGQIAFHSHFPWVGLAALRYDRIGIVAAELAAVSFAFYNVYAQHLIQLYDRWTVLVYSLLGATSFWLLLNPPWKIAAQHYGGAEYAFLAVFSVISMLVPFSLYFAGLQYLDPTRAIVTSCLEPVWAIALTALLLGEYVSRVQVFGVAIVLAATILVQRPDRRRAGEPVIAMEPIE